MNRRTLVLGTAVTALVGVCAAAWFSSPPNITSSEMALQPLDAEVLVRPNSPMLGPADAPVTLVEIFDPSCEACRDFYPVVENLRREFPTELRVVLRYAVVHVGSDEAVRILEAARAQGVFEPVLGALLERQPDWDHDAPELDQAWSIAGEAGLDVAAGQAYRRSQEVVALLDQDATDLKALHLRELPAFFVNGQPLDELKIGELIAAVRAEVERTGG